MSFLRLPNITDIVNKLPFVNKYVIGSWTILDHETQRELCTFDTFLGYDSNKDNQVMNYPIEEGSFASYNKIVNPTRITVYLARSGYPLQLKTTLQVLEEYADSTKKVDVILPFKSFVGYNIEKISHSMQSGDAGDQLIVSLPMVEIKEVSITYKTVKLSPKKVKSPSLSDTVKTGKKQTEDQSKNKSLLLKLSQSIGLFSDN